MIDPTIQRLLEQAIDSSIKLQLLLMYYENPRYEGTAQQVAERIFRDIWSAREALRELAEDGILGISGAGEPVYRYRPIAEFRESIFRLIQSYNEPLERDQIQRALREIASYAPYRRASQGSLSFDRLPL
ncbi:MAG TPA: hypothetical protein VFX76_04915 [Roseiflexaceae bacterium]|nr:hypothetical protein [Roseiflexaceae bacterium]